MEKAYSNDVEFLAGALELLRKRLRLRIHLREAEGQSEKDPILAVTEVAPDLEALEKSYQEAKEQHEGRLDQSHFQPAFFKVTKQFSLGGFEQDLLLLALAEALDGSFMTLFGRAKGGGFRAKLDIEIALNLLCDSFQERLLARSAFSREGVLLSEHLLQIGRASKWDEDAFLSLELSLPRRLVALFLGQEEQDESLFDVSQLMDPKESFDQVVLPPQLLAALKHLAEAHAGYLEQFKAWEIGKVLHYGRGLSLLFSGPPGTGKTLTAKAFAAHLGRPLLWVSASRLLSKGDFDRVVEHLFREAKLQEALVFFDECDSLFSKERRISGQLSSLLKALEHFDGVSILATNVPELLDPAIERRILHHLRFPVPKPSLREAIWRLHLPDTVPKAPGIDLKALSRRFEFSGGYIKNACLWALTKASMKSPPLLSEGDLLEGAKIQLRHQLSQYAKEEEGHLSLADLILPDEVKQQVLEVIEAVSAQSLVLSEWGFQKKFSKGRGLSALFDGEPGTGKTLSAEVIAYELGLPLYRVNVAQIVSKYIGETEKNLTAIFQEAKSSQSILLFDEADALFSKRVDVKQSQDRFSNMEINVLLQLLERHDGLVILTTNLKTSMDKAFERRLSFKVNFPFPDRHIREQIWRLLIPEEAPLSDDVDFSELAEAHELSGGAIKNVILRAAYRAASEKEKLSMAHFQDSAKKEAQAMGKVVRAEGSRSDLW